MQKRFENDLQKWSFYDANIKFNEFFRKKVTKHSECALSTCVSWRHCLIFMYSKQLGLKWNCRNEIHPKVSGKKLNLHRTINPSRLDHTQTSGLFREFHYMRQSIQYTKCALYWIAANKSRYFKDFKWIWFSVQFQCTSHCTHTNTV